MLIHTETFNPYHTNCYFLTDEASGSTVVIDPGCYFRRERTRINRLIHLNGWKIELVIATHLHIDHVFGAHFLTETCGCPFCASPLDSYWVSMASGRCREVGLEARMPFILPTRQLRHGDSLCFGQETLSVISVPGHSPGSLVFYSPGANCLFTGDTLIKGCIGRTDLPGGDRELLIRSIRQQLFSFADDTRVYPGHYETTDIGTEKAANPFFQDHPVL